MAFSPSPITCAPSGELSRKRPVAAYLRSATELQGESFRGQLEAIVPYARARGMQLIRVYCDECESGLRNGGRSGLQQMFRDIESGPRDFDALLMLDPSRWGRFQDPDQGACLEFACGQAAIEVHYCAEEIAADEPPLSRVIKALKRHMADEYAREQAGGKRHAAGASSGDGAAPLDGTTAKAKTR